MNNPEISSDFNLYPNPAIEKLFIETSMVNSTSQNTYNSCPLTHEEADALLRKVNPQVANNSFDAAFCKVVKEPLTFRGVQPKIGVDRISS